MKNKRKEDEKMIKYRYGFCSDEQFTEYKKSLHSLIHWILRYKDNGENNILKDYFGIVQFKLNGANALLEYNPLMLQIISLIESASAEFNKGEKCNKKLFRSAILDAHSLIDKL